MGTTTGRSATVARRDQLPEVVPQQPAAPLLVVERGVPRMYEHAADRATAARGQHGRSPATSSSGHDPHRERPQRDERLRADHVGDRPVVPGAVQLEHGQRGRLRIDEPVARHPMPAIHHPLEAAVDHVAGRRADLHGEQRWRGQLVADQVDVARRPAGRAAAQSAGRAAPGTASTAPAGLAARPRAAVRPAPAPRRHDRIQGTGSERPPRRTSRTSSAPPRVTLARVFDPPPTTSERYPHPTPASTIPAGTGLTAGLSRASRRRWTARR